MYFHVASQENFIFVLPLQIGYPTKFFFFWIQVHIHVMN